MNIRTITSTIILAMLLGCSAARTAIKGPPEKLYSSVKLDVSAKDLIASPSIGKNPELVQTVISQITNRATGELSQRQGFLTDQCGPSVAKLDINISGIAAKTAGKASSWSPFSVTSEHLEKMKIYLTFRLTDCNTGAVISIDDGSEDGDDYVEAVRRAGSRIAEFALEHQLAHR